MRLLVSVVAACLMAVALGCQRAAVPTAVQAVTESPESIVGQLADASDFQGPQYDLLWKLTQTPPETRFQVLALLLSNENGAAKFNRQASQIAQCCVGLDKELRSRISKELIAPCAESPPAPPAQRSAVLLLAAELHLTRDFPELAVIGMNGVLQLAKNKEHPADWLATHEAFGQWIDALPADQFPAMLYEMEWAAESNRQFSGLFWTRNCSRIAKRLIQTALAKPDEAESLRILTGEAKQLADPAAASRAADRLLEIIEEHPERNLQTALLKFVGKIPGGLSADQARRAMKMMESEFLESKSLYGVGHIVSNLSPQAVVVVVAELAKWYGWETAAPRQQRSDGTRGEIYSLLNTACEQADAQTAGEALLAYETSVKATNFPSVMPYFLLVQKLPRETAQEYRNGLATFKNSDIIAFVARGLAESEVALTADERVEQIRFLAIDLPLKFRLHSSRPLGETLAATCQRLDDEHRGQAVSILLEAAGIVQSHEAQDAICMGLASLASSFAPEEAAAAVQAVTRVASRSNYNDADRIVEQLKQIIDDRPVNETNQYAEGVLRSIASCTSGSDGPLTSLSVELARQVPETDMADLARKAVVEMVNVDPKTHSYDSAISSLMFVASGYADRLEPEARGPVARLLAEEATKALNRDSVKDKYAANRLAFRLVFVLGKLPAATPPDAAEKLLDAWLRVFVPPGVDFRGEIEIGLPAVASCIPAAASLRFRERLRSLAGDAATPLANRIRIVDACLPLDISREEAAALTAAITKGHRYEVAYNLAQLANAAPLLADKLDDEQLLKLIEEIAGLYAKDPFFVQVDSIGLVASLVTMVSKESCLGMVRTLLHAYPQMHTQAAQNALNSALKSAFERLSPDDLPVVLDEILTLFETSQNTAPDANRATTKQKPAEFPEVVVRQWFEDLAAENKEHLVSVLKRPAYQGKIQILGPLLPPTVREAAGFVEDPPGDKRRPGPVSLAEQLMPHLPPENPKPLELGRIVELLKHPECVGSVRSVLLSHLSQHTGREYDDVWQFVDSAAEAGISSADLLRPPRRETS